MTETQWHWKWKISPRYKKRAQISQEVRVLKIICMMTYWRNLVAETRLATSSIFTWISSSHFHAYKRLYVSSTFSLEHWASQYSTWCLTLLGYCLTICQLGVVATMTLWQKLTNSTTTLSNLTNNSKRDYNWEVVTRTLGLEIMLLGIMKKNKLQSLS